MRSFAVEKIIKNPDLSFGPIRLYLDDIIEIVELFKKIGENATVEITLGDYKYSNIDELKKTKGKKYQEIEIECKTYSPHLSISLKVSKYLRKLSCYSSEESMLLRGVFAEAEGIIKTHQRKLQWIRLLFTVFGITDSLTATFFRNQILLIERTE
jgi:hypothetical protein